MCFQNALGSEIDLLIADDTQIAGGMVFVALDEMEAGVIGWTLQDLFQRPWIQ